jgi:hypothetical protein
MPEDPHVADADAVRERAYEISLEVDAGSPEKNWLRAVDELRDERAATDARARPAGEPEPPFPPNTAALTHP